MKTRSRYLPSLFIVLIAVHPALVSSAPSASSAYLTDAQSSYVEDHTSEGINTVNMITCLMSAMRPDALVNQGDYIALVDEAKCDPRSRDSASNSGSSNSGSSAAQYATVRVNSSRASNSDPMIGKIWLDENGGGQQATIFVHAAATAAPSAADPYGTFRVDFCGKAPGNACMFNGFLDVGSSGLSFYEVESDNGGNRSKAMTLNANGTTSGSGKMSILQSGGAPASSTFTFAYNANHFRRDDGNTDQCFSRDAADPDTGFSVWRYGLYDVNTGTRITRNSGFPIVYTAGGTTYHGYMGYHGLWLPPDVLSSISTGATVKKVNYDNGAANAVDYTLFKAGGKLTKYTKGTKTLAAIDQIRFNFWAYAVSGPAGLNGYTQNRHYEAYWDNTNRQFVITGYESCDNNGCSTTSITPVATLNTYWSANYPNGLSGWSPSLGGEVYIATGTLANDGSNSGSVNVTYRTQDLVYPSQYASIGSLYCISDCPTAYDIAALVAGSVQTPFGATAGRYVPTGSLVAYTLDATSGNMKDNTASNVVTSSTSLSGPFQGGIRSGRLFPASQVEAVDAADGAADGSYRIYSVDSLSVYYVWETGANPWNQFSAVKDAGGNFVTFDPPLQVNFTVPSGAAYGPYAGRTVVLQYNGFGDLFGIPGKCVSPVDNSVVSCNTASARYVPEFMIPFDQTSGIVTDSSSAYLVKWLHREIRLAKKDISVCAGAGLSLPSGISLPTGAGLKDPSNASSDVYIGAAPTVTSAPRVIHGEVQY